MLNLSPVRQDAGPPVLPAYLAPLALAVRPAALATPRFSLGTLASESTAWAFTHNVGDLRHVPLASWTHSGPIQKRPD